MAPATVVVGNRERQMRQSARLIAKAHRVCATVIWDHAPDEVSSLVCPVQTLGDLVLRVRTELGIRFSDSRSNPGSRSSNNKWSITVWDDYGTNKLTSATFQEAIAPNRGWALTYVRIRISEKKTEASSEL